MDWNNRFCRILAIITLFLLKSPQLVDSVTSLQFEVGAGKVECFFHPSKAGQEWEVEYQVLDGGDLDINFIVFDPNGAQLYLDQKSTDNLHKIASNVDGDYRVCFDNGFSRMTPKVLFFEIYEDEADDDHTDQFREYGGDIAWNGANDIDMTVAEIQQSLGKVHTDLEKAIKSQDSLRVLESRDRHVMEANYERVNNFSLFQLIVMVAAGVCQVYMIRSLFEDDSKIGKLLRGKLH